MSFALGPDGETILDPRTVFKIDPNHPPKEEQKMGTRLPYKDTNRTPPRRNKKSKTRAADKRAKTARKKNRK